MESLRYEINTSPDLGMEIEVTLNQKLDADSFYESIFSERYVTRWGFVKKAIFNLYPKLSEQLNGVEDSTEQKTIIQDFVAGLYTKYASQLESIIQNLTVLFLENKEKLLRALSITMDFEAKNMPHITITPSFKPSSTFGTQQVCLSIASEIFYNKPIPYLDVFIHEITHIIRNQKIGNVYDMVGKLGSLAHEDLKEIITPVVLRDNCFENVLKTDAKKYANDKQQLLQISVDGVVYTMVDYFESIYQNMKGKGIVFAEIMKEFVRIFLKIEDQIIAKHAIYNEFGFYSRDKEAVLTILKGKGYLDPIVLL